MKNKMYNKKSSPRRVFFISGAFFIFIGLAFIFNAIPSMTGFAIMGGISKFTLSIFGLVFVLIGFLLNAGVLTREKKSELELTLIDSSKDARTENPQRDYKIIDTMNDFDRRGAPLSLGEFESYIHSLHDPELVEYLKETYGPVFREKIVHGSSEEKKVARAFYEVLTGEKFEEGRYSLTKEEKERIKRVFRGYDGKITKEIRGVLDYHGLTIEHGRKHYRIVDKNGNFVKTLPVTPSDVRGSLNDASELIRRLEEIRNRKSKQA